MKSKLFAVLAALVVLFIASPAAFAQDAGAAAEGAGGFGAIGAGLAIGLAALGAALGQGRQGAAALEGIARNRGIGPVRFRYRHHDRGQDLNLPASFRKPAQGHVLERAFSLRSGKNGYAKKALFLEACCGSWFFSLRCS